MKTIALFFYGLAIASVLISHLISLEWLHMISKPLLMPALLFYYVTSVVAEERSRSLIIAIVFCFVGDVLLMKDEYFLSGLGAFLIAQIVYIIAYRQHRHEETEVSLQGLQRLRLAFPVILGGTGLITILYPALDDLKIPVVLYAVVLMVMVISAIFRMGRTSQSSFWMVFGGAILFMISDSLIAVREFLEPFAYAGFWTMLTYATAQFMIVKGLLIHNKT